MKFDELFDFAVERKSILLEAVPPTLGVGASIADTIAGLVGITIDLDGAIDIARVCEKFIPVECRVYKGHAHRGDKNSVISMGPHKQRNKHT